MRLGFPASNHNNFCRQRMEEAVSATPEGKERVEAGYGRLAEVALRASEREARIKASAPPVSAGNRPSSESAEWFVGDDREWKLWKVSGKSPAEYPEWRKGYLDRRMRQLLRPSQETVDAEKTDENPDDMEAKRARASSDNPVAATTGSGVELPPSADEPGSASHTSTTSRTGTGETQQAARGR